MPYLHQNALKQLNQPPKTFITINYFKIKSVACILADFIFQISFLRTLKAKIMKIMGDSQWVMEMEHEHRIRMVWRQALLLSHRWTKPAGILERWPTTHPTTPNRTLMAGLPGPYIRSERSVGWCPPHLQHQQGSVTCRSEALGSWHPSTGSCKHHAATLRVSSGSRCLVAAAQVSNSTNHLYSIFNVPAVLSLPLGKDFVVVVNLIFFSAPSRIAGIMLWNLASRCKNSLFKNIREEKSQSRPTSPSPLAAPKWHRKMHSPSISSQLHFDSYKSNGSKWQFFPNQYTHKRQATDG